MRISTYISLVSSNPLEIEESGIYITKKTLSIEPSNLLPFKWRLSRVLPRFKISLNVSPHVLAM